MEKTKPLKVLVVSSECAPFAKSGGLGDVIGSLPKVLRDNGVDAVSYTHLDVYKRQVFLLLMNMRNRKTT